MLAAGKIPASLTFRKGPVLNLVCILAFFPFFSLIPGLQAEVQPYCYIAALFFIALFSQKLPYSFLIVFVLCALYFIVFAVPRLYLELPLILQSVPHILIYIGPPAFFWVVYRHLELVNFRMLHRIFYIWVCVGFLQQLFPSVFAAVGLKSILQVLIPRFSVSNLGGWGDRGVTSLANEPSYAGIIIFGLYVTVIYRYIRNEISRRTFWFNSALYLVSLVYNASVTMFLLTMILVLAYVYQTRTYLAALLICALAISSFFVFEYTFRILDLIAYLPNMLEAADWNPYYVMIGPLGSHRELSSYVGIKSAFYHFFGNGYYSSMIDFIRIAKEMHVDLARATFFDNTFDGYYVNMKPYGYGALMLFELGVIPFVLVNRVLIKLLRAFKKEGGPFKRFGAFLAISSLLLINLNTPGSLPTYWFVFIIALFIMSDRGSGRNMPTTEAAATPGTAATAVH